MRPASLQMRVISRYVSWSARFLEAPHTCAEEPYSVCSGVFVDHRGCQQPLKWLLEILLPHGDHRDVQMASDGRAQALLASSWLQRTIVRKTSWASFARPPEPSALMSAFSRAVSAFRPLALTSCTTQHGVSRVLAAHMPGAAAEASPGAGARRLRRQGAAACAQEA